jgi:feruloyl esterase
MVCLIVPAVVIAALYGGLLAAEASASPGSSPARAPAQACSSLSGLPLPGLPRPDTATVTAAEVAGSGCQVAIEIADRSDPRGGDPGMIGIDLTLPDSWNGNYMAEGGGVYCGPAGFVTLAADQWLAAGYAISQTDCGHTGYANALISPWVCPGSTPSPTFACQAAGGLNWNRIDDFGYLSFHLEAVESKFVIDRYYANRAQYSFWNGCSTGGRQGLSEAERYPTDFNGVLAGAPALNWDQFMVAQMWPQLVMEWSGDELSACKENLVNTTLQAKCADQDGQVDGVFDPRTCDVIGVLRSLIGTSTPCGVFTATDARVIQEIWQGPRLSGSQSNLLTGLPVWFGMEPGANLSGVFVPPPILGPGGGLGLATTFAPNPASPDVLAGAPFIPSDDWFQKWIKQDPSWVYTEESYQQYWQDFLKSGRMFDYAMAADNPNLSAFRAAGGKLIMWQGLADQLIFTGDSINFYNRAIAANGGLNRTEQFWRYFVAPGVAHCGTPGAGSIAPTNPMQQVIDWVEHGHAPAALDASGTINGQAVTRPLCPYPDPDAVYTGGDPNQAGSYTCRNTVQLDNPFQPGPAGNQRRAHSRAGLRFKART